MGVVSRYMATLGKKHWKAVKGIMRYIMRYLKGTMHVCICFRKKDLVLHGFTDSDFAGCVDQRKSTTGYVFTLGGGAMSWISRLQKCIALSTTEAEYVAATKVCKDTI